MLALLVLIAPASPAHALSGDISTIAGDGTSGRFVADAVTTNADGTLTSATANFAVSDVGLTVTGAGIPDNTMIVSRTSSTEVELSANATVTATNVGVHIVSLLNGPQCVAVDGDNADIVYIADTQNHRVRALNRGTTAATVHNVTIGAGALATIAGTAVAGLSGDGGQAVSAKLDRPICVVRDNADDVLYVSDTGNNRVRKITSGGVISTFAGNGIADCSPTPCGNGDGGAAVSAQLSWPAGLALDGSSNLYIADFFHNRVRRVTSSTGNIATVAGGGSVDALPPPVACRQVPFTSIRVCDPRIGDGESATGARAVLQYPIGVAVNDGVLYIAEQGGNRVRGVNLTGSNKTVFAVTIAAGNIDTIVGTGMSGYSGDGGKAELAQLSAPFTVVVTGSSDLARVMYISDEGNHRIRRVTDQSLGLISTYAGNPPPCNPANGCAVGSWGGAYGGDGGPALQAQLFSPRGVVLQGSSPQHLLIGDQYNHRVRMVEG